jgi:hypothetical protein
VFLHSKKESGFHCGSFSRAFYWVKPIGMFVGKFYDNGKFKKNQKQNNESRLEAFHKPGN